MSYVKYHPIYLDLNGRPVLIVGGGKVCMEKLNSLLPSGARITVIALWACEQVHRWHAEGVLTLIEREFRVEDVDGYFMVIAATDDPATNALVFRTGEAANKLSNSVDDPVNCNFIMAAITGYGPMQVAISSAGCSPALAQRVRNRIRDEILSEEMGDLAAYLGSWRPRIKAALPSFKARQGFWERVIESDIPELLANSGEAAADGKMADFLAWASEHPSCLACGKIAPLYRCVGCLRKNGERVAAADPAGPPPLADHAAHPEAA